MVEANAQAAALLGCDIANIAGLRLSSFRRLCSLLTRKGAPEVVHGTISIPHVVKKNHALEAQTWMSSHNSLPFLVAILRDTSTPNEDADRTLQ